MYLTLEGSIFQREGAATEKVVHVVSQVLKMCSKKVKMRNSVKYDISLVGRLPRDKYINSFI